MKKKSNLVRFIPYFKEYKKELIIDLLCAALTTGCEIALRRARINALRGYRDDLKIRLSALNQYYHSMNMSHRFNEKSYENKMLQRQIRQIKFDLDTTKEMIAGEELSLRAYIKSKDVFYTQTRKRRQKANNN